VSLIPLLFYPTSWATTLRFKRTRTESHRIAELLAQLPAEIDMHAIVAEMLLKNESQNDDGESTAIPEQEEGMGVIDRSDARDYLDQD
jgi:hypothetical protein